MKGSSTFPRASLGIIVVFLGTLLLLAALSVTECLQLAPDLGVSSNDQGGLSTRNKNARNPNKEEGSKDFMEIYATGSRLPDCSHACGPCFPCRRVMVSFKCSLSESCPIVYRCMCRGRYYHVPSN